ncbi:hypothetical protein HK099_006932, partial [Clydaea vesicula]
GISTGKSTVINLIKNKKPDYKIVDADLIAREEVKIGSPALKKIVKAFGKEVLLEDGNLDRVKVGNIIFNDSKKRLVLNGITHPYIRLEMLRMILFYQLTFQRLIFLDIPLLYESKLDKFMTSVVVVYCNVENQLKRLKLRNSINSDEEALKKINSQISIEEKKQKANFVVDNNGSLLETEQNLVSVLNDLESVITSKSFKYLKI